MPRIRWKLYIIRVAILKQYTTDNDEFSKLQIFENEENK